MKLYTLMMRHPDETQEFNVLAVHDYDAKRQALEVYTDPEWVIVSIIESRLTYNEDGTVYTPNF